MRNSSSIRSASSSLGGAAEVSLALDGLPKKFQSARVTRYVIDQEQSNSYTAWQKMGSPQQPTPQQYAQLEQAGKLAVVAASDDTVVMTELGTATVRFQLPRQAVTLLVLAATP